MLKFQDNKGTTPLMQSMNKGYPCSDELKLLAEKSAGLDLVDHHQ